MSAAPLAARSFGTGFTHGVASGEPSQTGVILWTRFVGEVETVEWRISENPDLAQPIASGTTPVSAERDHCAKVELEGALEPGRWYFYQFEAPDGRKSVIGRTRTLPEGPVPRFNIAVFSCSNFGFGYFNAYAHAAEANDCELALHLGDYIYEYRRGSYPSDEAAHPDRPLWPEHEIVALADYRLRYATYRNDPDLRRIHQVMPMISIWDDHEFANNSWKDGAENHQSETEGDWETRKAIARRVYCEWMPVSERNYARYEIGDLATLYRLDTRIEGRDKQLDLGEVLGSATSAQDAIAKLTAFKAGALADPERQMLGAEQELWLSEGLKSSRASGRKWQVLAQQVLMGEILSPPGVIEQVQGEVPDYVRRRLNIAALAGKAGVPASMDAWDGYPAARKRLLEAAKEADAELVVLAGDSHNAWGFELAVEGKPVGVEFGTSSVSSPGLETSLQGVPPTIIADALVKHNEGLKWTDCARRGYLRLELTPAAVTSEFRFTGSVKTRSAKLEGTHTMRVPSGKRAFEG